jgi:hypothetical protein
MPLSIFRQIVVRDDRLALIAALMRVMMLVAVAKVRALLRFRFSERAIHGSVASSFTKSGESPSPVTEVCSHNVQMVCTRCIHKGARTVMPKQRHMDVTLFSVWPESFTVFTA